MPEDLGTSSALSTRGCTPVPNNVLVLWVFFPPIPRLGSNSACYISMTTFVLPALATWSSTWALPPPPWPEELTALRHRLIFFVLKQHFGIEEDKVTRSAPPKPCSGLALLLTGLQNSFCALS